VRDNRRAVSLGMGRAEPKPLITPEEYLERERKAEFKSEYYRGEVFAMAGASPNHVTIIRNLTVALDPCLLAKGCWFGTNDVRVFVEKNTLFTYPDLVIVCGTPEYLFSGLETLVNPTAIIEVLSRSTREYDLYNKFALYRDLLPLREYIVIDSEKRHIEKWVKTTQWTLDEATGDDAVDVSGCLIMYDQVYRLIEF
jgi:Uma2 family endonuclease